MTNASEKRAPLGTLRALLSILLAIAVLVAAQTLALLLGEVLLGAGVPGPACNVLTAVLYVLFALGGAALTDWGAVGAALSASGPGTAGWILTMGVVTAVLPYVLYAVGLEHMESSRASILASVEPVVGTLVGVLLFHEPLTAGGVAGTALVLSAVALLSLPARAKTS